MLNYKGVTKVLFKSHKSTKVQVQKNRWKPVQTRERQTCTKGVSEW